MHIKVLQGERELAHDNWSLGEFDDRVRARAQGRARVGVQFEIDAERHPARPRPRHQDGPRKVVQLTSAVDVSDEAVEKMIEESLEHAFDDMSERVLTETRLKAEEMLAAVTKALPLADERLSRGGASPDRAEGE